MLTSSDVLYGNEQKEGDKFLETAQNHGIPLESLPAYLGGGHPGRPMNNTFKPSVADAPLPAPQQKATEMPVRLSFSQLVCEFGFLSRS